MSRLRHAFNIIKYPLVTVGRSYNEVAQRYPFSTGVVTTVVKTSAADLFAQKVPYVCKARHVPGALPWHAAVWFTEPHTLTAVVGDRKEGGGGLEAAWSVHHLWAVLPGEGCGL